MLIDHSFIGKEYSPISYEMGREKIKEYARAVGDLNPLYLDEDAAAGSQFGDIIASPAMAALFRLPGAWLSLRTDPETGSLRLRLPFDEVPERRPRADVQDPHTFRAVEFMRR